MRTLCMISAMSLLLAVGCDDGRGDGTDAGGGIVLMDAGPGMTGTDAGPGMTGTDAGPGGGCPPAEAPAPTMSMVCAASTLTCLMGATDAASQQACIDADPMPDACNGCINQELIASCSSASGGGCNNEWGEVECCLQAECPSGDAACINSAIGTMAAPGPCAGAFNSFASCANSAAMAGACGISNFCFQM